MSATAEPSYGVVIPTDDPFVADTEIKLLAQLATMAFRWAEYWRAAPTQEGFDPAPAHIAAKMMERAAMWEERGNDATEAHDAAVLRLEKRKNRGE